MVWARLSEVGQWCSGGTPKADNASYYGGDIPWFRITELNEGRLTESFKTLTRTGLENSSATIIQASLPGLTRQSVRQRNRHGLPNFHNRLASAWMRGSSPRMTNNTVTSAMAPMAQAP
jgi:hypothetical protein